MACPAAVSHSIVGSKTGIYIRFSFRNQTYFDRTATGNQFHIRVTTLHLFNIAFGFRRQMGTGCHNHKYRMFVLHRQTNGFRHQFFQRRPATSGETRKACKPLMSLRQNKVLFHRKIDNPITGTELCTKAMLTVNSPFRFMNSLVPSKGSTIHRVVPCTSLGIR